MLQIIKQNIKNNILEATVKNIIMLQGVTLNEY